MQFFALFRFINKFISRFNKPRVGLKIAIITFHHSAGRRVIEVSFDNIPEPEKSINISLTLCDF